MTLGTSTIGSSVVGGITLGAQPAFEAPTFGHVDSPPDLRVLSPFLQFWEVVPENGAISRFVDFADPEASAVLGEVTFNGEQWTSVKIGRPKFTAGKGRKSTATVTVVDPTRTVITWAIDNDVKNSYANVYIVKYENLADPSLATQLTVFVNEVVATDDPLRVAFLFGGAEIRDLRYPAIFFGREGCHNSFEDRFDHASGRNYCNYPSDEFEPQTSQVFDQTVATEVVLDHGWRVLNGDQPDLAVSGQFQNVDENLRVDIDTNSSQWMNATRTGFYAYKILQDVPTSSKGQTSDADFDVSTKISVITSDDTIAGILAQSIDSPGDWVLFATDQELGAARLVFRDTDDDVTTESFISVGDNALRMTRTGSEWKFYSRVESTSTRAVSTAPWTERSSGLTFSMTGNLRVGLVACSFSATAATCIFKFHHFRFAKGGFNQCNRSLQDCELRENTIQRNGYLGLPDTINAF